MPPPPSLSNLCLFWPVQWPHLSFLPPSASHVSSGETRNEEAEVTAAGAAVPLRARGKSRFSAQPASTYEGKQGDQCWDHWGDSGHRTCLNTQTHTLTHTVADIF